MSNTFFSEMSSPGGKENARAARQLRRSYDQSVRSWCAFYGVEVASSGPIAPEVYNRYAAEHMKDVAWLCH
jgi:hypothetical protein